MSICNDFTCIIILVFVNYIRMYVYVRRGLDEEFNSFNKQMYIRTRANVARIQEIIIKVSFELTINSILLRTFYSSYVRTD